MLHKSLKQTKNLYRFNLSVESPNKVKLKEKSKRNALCWHRECYKESLHGLLLLNSISEFRLKPTRSFEKLY